MSHYILDWMAPQYCVLCGRRIYGQQRVVSGPLCKSCASNLPSSPLSRCRFCGAELFGEDEICYSCRNKTHSYEEVFPLFRYRDAPATLIRSYKMSQRKSLASFWANLVYEVLQERWPKYVLVPVPPRPEKIKTHEWDQVEAIASRLEREGVPVVRPLVRMASEEQKSLGREGRKANASKGYEYNPEYHGDAPQLVVLFDDVYTTGATAEACSRALLTNGAKKVAVLVLAMD